MFVPSFIFLCDSTHPLHHPHLIHLPFFFLAFRFAHVFTPTAKFRVPIHYFSLVNPKRPGEWGFIFCLSADKQVSMFIVHSLTKWLQTITLIITGSIQMYGVSHRYDGSRPQSVLVCVCVRLWLCRPIRDAQIRSQTWHTNVSMFVEGWMVVSVSYPSGRRTSSLRSLIDRSGRYYAKG